MMYEQATGILAAVEQAFHAEGKDLPARRSVYLAPIPADCEQVAVLLGQIRPFPGMDSPDNCSNALWVIDISVIVTRCTPALPGKNGQAPKAEKMNEAAMVASTDAMILRDFLHTVDNVMDVSVITGPPAGGLQTVELNFTTYLDV